MSKKFLQRPADTLYNFQLYNFLPIKFISLQSLVLKRRDNRTPCISPLISPLLLHAPHLLYSSINQTLKSMSKVVTLIARFFISWLI